MNMPILLACGETDSGSETHTITGLSLTLYFDKRMLSKTGIFEAEAYEGTVTVDGTAYSLSAAVLNRASGASIFFFDFSGLSSSDWAKVAEGTTSTNTAILQDLVSGGLSVDGQLGVPGNETDGYGLIAAFAVSDDDWGTLLTDTEDAGYEYAMLTIYQPDE